jgi:hypothetical protein
MRLRITWYDGVLMVEGYYPAASGGGLLPSGFWWRATTQRLLVEGYYPAASG